MKQTTPAEEEIFLQAVEMPDALRREEFLGRICASNAQLRRSIDAMLADHDQATRLFRDIGIGFTLDEDATADDPGDLSDDSDLGASIGPYRLIRRLGEGGGGIVYEAQQDAPVCRKVALKILKSGMDKWRVMNRFQSERQALELMEHPNIARVLDAGVTPDGRPYFVMELVRGAKITEHCIRHAIPFAARLQLLQQVCSAVEHAHQKGIIHCDLKPSNIIVTLVEGTPVPKVIDFGIAKATASTPSNRTGQGCPIGTPAYMSPEQLGGSKDIDTRSDIYSLGIILYELLAGRPPFDMEEFSRTGTHELRHWLSHEVPPPPSHLVRQITGSRGQWNEDLDFIVMTALDKDRERRYPTVRSLSQDIARYLANEPIHARPPSRLYRLRKLVQRNRLASGAIAAGILVLATGFTSSSLLYLRAEAAERKQAQLRLKAEEAERTQAQLRAEAEERAYVTKAAILLMQNKTAEADAEIQHMGGMLMHPSVEATNVFRTLATWNALRGDWKAASQRLLALSRVNRFDDSDMTDNATRDLVPIAPTLVETGDFEALRQFQELLLQRLGHTNNPIAAEQVLKICLLLPPSPEILTRLEPAAGVAQRSLPVNRAAPRNWLQSWRYFAVGLWHYRIANYDQSIRLTNAVLNAHRDDAVILTCCLLVRSMAHRELGQTAYADADLAEAQGIIERKFSSPLEMDNEGLWHDWLTARILLREAAHQ